jgi:glutaredoxin
VDVYNIERKMITVYSKNNCPFCVQAKQLLESKGVSYTEVNIEQDPDARQMLVDQGLRSVPQIFYGYEIIPGGFQGLAKQPQEFFNKLKG